MLERSLRRTAQTILTATGVAATLALTGPHAQAAPNGCISVNGHTRNSGTATCDSTTGNLAIARGDNASASATNGKFNGAGAFGDGSEAIAGGGNRNFAIAVGNAAGAAAGGVLTTTGNNGNVAIARNSNRTSGSAQALAIEGSNNRAVAKNSGTGETGAATIFGDNNRARATGSGSGTTFAAAGKGDKNIATATGSGAGFTRADAAHGDNNRATVVGGDLATTADAGLTDPNDDNNTATCKVDGASVQATGGTTVSC